MTTKFMPLTTEMITAWSKAIERRRIDPSGPPHAPWHEVVDAAELGVRLFDHVCATCHGGLVVVDERATHPRFPEFMRGLDDMMRTWYRAAARLAPVVTRDVGDSRGSRGTRAFVSRTRAVSRAIAKAGRQRLQFDDFATRFSAFQDPIDSSPSVDPSDESHPR